MPISERLFEEAQKIMVGGVNSPVRSFRGVGGSPRFIKRGEGSRLYCEDGKSYIDYVMSWGPLLFGHTPREVIEALQAAMVNGTSFGAPCKAEIDLARLIQHFFPSCEKIRLVNSGSEATMSAIRLARGFTGKRKIIKFNGCYHGHVDALLVQAGSGGLTFGIPDSAGVLDDTTKHTLLCEFNDRESVKKAFQEHPEDIAAVILEPVTGNMGVVLPHNDFLSFLRDICSEHNCLLIFDEVMTGFRVTPGGVQSLYNIKPDLTCLGKVIGGGLPCGAFGGKKEIMDFLAPNGPVYQAGTLSGNPLAAAAGIAQLTRLKNNPESYKHAENMTLRLTDGLKSLLRKKNLNFRVEAIGTMFTLFFTSRPIFSLKDVKTSDTEQFGQFFHKLLDRGIYMAPSQFEANFMSSAHTEKDIDYTLAVMEEVL